VFLIVLLFVYFFFGHHGFPRGGCPQDVGN
jgi:hypothetical protein